MSAKLFTIGVAIFLGVAFAMFLFIDSISANGNFNEATGLVVSSDSFPTYLKTHPAFSSLPRGSSIGIKIGESDYEIEGRDIKKVESLNDENDIVVSLPEGYEAVIGELGLCEALRKAYSENSISVETFANKAKLFFKYSSLIKYNNCLK